MKKNKSDLGFGTNRGTYKEIKDRRFDDGLSRKQHPEIYEAVFDAMYEQDKKYFPWIYEGRK